MPNYRRLISYIYAYEGGVKGKNIGFAKIESRGIQCKITVNVKKIYVGSNDTGVYLLAEDQEIFLGNIFIRGGSGEFRTVVSMSDVEHSGISMENCFGLTVHDVENTWRSYTTIWEDAVAHAAEVELAEAASVGKAKEEEVETVSVEKLKETVRQIEAEFPAEPVSPEKPSYIPAVEFATEFAAEPLSGSQLLSEPPASDAEKVSSVYEEPSEILHNQPARQAAILGKATSYGRNWDTMQFAAEIPDQGTEYQQSYYNQQDRDSEWQTGGTVFGRWENEQSEAEAVNRAEEHRWGRDHVRSSGYSGQQDFGNSGYQGSVFWEQPEAAMPNTSQVNQVQPALSVVTPVWETPVPPQAAPAPHQEAPAPHQEAPEPAQEAPEPAPSQPAQEAPEPAPSQPAQEMPAGMPQPADSMNEEITEALVHDRIWGNLKREHTKITAFDYEKGCEILTIKPQDIGLLPRDIWGYGNNSFLLHGYYNYRYLILARLNNPEGIPRYLLGVPGHYYSNEQYMASMFGFPNFVLSKDQPLQDGRFGYWYTDVRLQDVPEEDD